MWPGLFDDDYTGGLSDKPVDLEDIDPSVVAAASSIFRVWTPGRGSSGRIGDEQEDRLPLQPQARRAQENYDPLIDDPVLRCVAMGMPGIIDNPFPLQFEDRGDFITMRFEEWGAERTIHMADTTVPRATPDSPYGYSVGRWEGNTLIVETSHINYPYFDDAGTPQSTGVQVLERYTLSDDETRLDLSMTITDPQTFTEPVQLDGAYWDWAPNETIKPYECNLND